MSLQGPGGGTILNPGARISQDIYVVLVQCHCCCLLQELVIPSPIMFGGAVVQWCQERRAGLLQGTVWVVEGVME